jgi:hypothetical protein
MLLRDRYGLRVLYLYIFILFLLSITNKLRNTTYYYTIVNTILLG